MAHTVVVEGTVLHVDRREGIGKTSGEPYRIDTVRVLVAETGTAELTLGKQMVPPIKGEAVQYLADTDVYGGQVQLRAIAVLDAAA